MRIPDPKVYCDFCEKDFDPSDVADHDGFYLCQSCGDIHQQHHEFYAERYSDDVLPNAA